jgi:hypothetical protein
MVQDIAYTLGISARQAYRLNVKYRFGGAQAMVYVNREESLLTP